MPSEFRHQGVASELSQEKLQVVHRVLRRLSGVQVSVWDEQQSITGISDLALSRQQQQNKYLLTFSASGTEAAGL